MIQNENFMPRHSGTLIVVSGPSGTGKNTVLAKLKEKIPELTYSVSATTRAPRDGEIEGQHYFFMTCSATKLYKDKSPVNIIFYKY